jgi:inorganic triphosphatase YgiF
MPVETELKLQIDPQNVARLARHDLFKRATKRVTRKLYSVYYDTPALDLWRSGMTLRLRRSGSHWVQTVKGGGDVTAGLHRREEFETAIASPIPDFDALRASAAATYFASPELRANLRPVIVTEFTRTQCVLAPADGVAIEFSIDRGHIKSGDATVPVCEVELEIKEGPAWRAYQVAMQLLDVAPLRIENRSKAARGIELHLDTQPAPVRMPALGVFPAMSANDVFKTLIVNCLAHYTGNQRGMLEEDNPEYLHQMRVALRRLRSVFSTFAPLFPPAVLAPPVAETRWLGGALGEARDWDVFAIEALPPVMARYAHHPGLEALARTTARLRAGANHRARRAVVSTRGQGLLLALGAWTSAETWLEALDDTQHGRLQQPAIDYAREVLSATQKRVRKRGRNFAELAPADLHRLRVAAKRLRYATEFFSPLFDAGAAREYRAVLARLQDALGSYNDAVKMTQLAERASRDATDASANEARGIVLGWSAGMQDAGTRYLKRAWKDFQRADAFWN